MIKCKNCGADMRFDIQKQLLVCDYCDSVTEVKNVHHTDITSEEQVMEAVVHTCPQCGAELYTTEETAATFCSYCGSSVLLEKRLIMVNKPDYIIPFSVNREEAEKAYKRKLARAIFAPKALKEAEIESIRGIYMPYWEYYVRDDSVTSLNIDLHSHREGDYVCADVYKLSFDKHIECDGLEYDASSRLPDDLSQACAPYYFKESKLFNSGYMSGFYADLGDVDPDIYLAEVNNTVSEIAAEEIIRHSKLRSYGVTAGAVKNSLSYAEIKPGLAMYPMWFACARDKKDKYINYAVVNGQSGKAAADLPVDKKKIIIGTFIFAIPLFLLMYFLFTPNPTSTLVIMAILSVVGTVLGIRQVDDMGRDDKGAGKYKSKPSKKEKDERAYEKKKMRWRMIAAIAICAITIFFHPVMDIFYYIAAIVAGVLCGWTYWRLFELYNRSTLRPLPQLDKRGGDGA